MADRTAHPTTSDERLSPRGWLSGGTDLRKGHTGGLLSALILGSLIVVVAMIGLTIAIGRAPTQAAAGESPVTPASPSAAPTSYPSPEPTGPRYTAEPIIMDAPQKPPHYEPASSAPSSQPTSVDEQDDADDTDQAEDEAVEEAANRVADLEEEIQQRLRERFSQLSDDEDD